MWTRFLCEPHDVWALKTEPKNLARELRPYVLMTMSEADQEKIRRALSADGRTRVSARLAPVGIEWPMELAVIEAGRRYRDTSKNSLFKQWTHDHQILPASDGCLYVDEVAFESALPYCKATALSMERLMKHRHRVAARYLPTELGGVGVSALRLDCSSDAG